MKSKLGVIVVAVLIAWSLKRHYADARADDLRWILTPTSRAVTAMTGATFTSVPGEGYFSRDRMFLIEKSCAGINFMIAAFAMLVFALFHRAGSFRSATGVLSVSVLASYCAAVLVNAVRITIAMWLAPVGDAVHRVEGIIVYFAGLVLLYGSVLLFDRDARVRHIAVPLASYYAVTIAIPLANGAAGSGAHFVNHALVVFVAPLFLIALAMSLRRVCGP